MGNHVMAQQRLIQNHLNRQIGILGGRTDQAQRRIPRAHHCRKRSTNILKQALVGQIDCHVDGWWRRGIQQQSTIFTQEHHGIGLSARKKFGFEFLAHKLCRRSFQRKHGKMG